METLPVPVPVCHAPPAYCDIPIFNPYPWNAVPSKEVPEDAQFSEREALPEPAVRAIFHTILSIFERVPAVKAVPFANAFVVAPLKTNAAKLLPVFAPGLIVAGK